MDVYTVIVDDVGETYAGDSQVDAQAMWIECVKLAQEPDNPMTGRAVTLYHDNAVMLRYERLEQ